MINYIIINILCYNIIKFTISTCKSNNITTFKLITMTFLALKFCFPECYLNIIYLTYQRVVTLKGKEKT